MPAKQATRWMAPATPVFAGAPAPTWAVLASRQVMSMRGGAVVWPMLPVLARSPCEAALCREKPALNRPVLGFEAGSISCGRLPSPFGLRCRAENNYRSSDAFLVGAALCCEGVGTSNR